MSATPFLGFLMDPAQIRTVVDAMETAVAVSYATVGGTRTHAEDRDRVLKCVAWIRVMRGDMRWSLERIRDELPSALCAQLQGVNWEPAKNPAWAGAGRFPVIAGASLRHVMPD